MTEGTTASESNVAGCPPRVHQLLSKIAAYLDAVRCGDPVSAIIPLWHLRTLRDECHQAGFADIVRLCGQMEIEIINLLVSSFARPERSIAEIARISGLIRGQALRACEPTHNCD